jgi:hypothetical protein
MASTALAMTPPLVSLRSAPSGRDMALPPSLGFAVEGDFTNEYQSRKKAQALKNIAYDFFRGTRLFCA